VKYVNEICRIEYDDKGQPIRSVGTVQDITALKELKDELRSSQTRYEALFNHLSSGVAVYEAVDEGSDFVFLDFNPVAERIDGIAKGDVLGRRLTQVFPGVREFGLLDVLRRVWRTGQTEQYPDAFYEDGRVKGWRENEVYRLPSGEVVAVYRDITRRKGIERSLHISQAEKALILDAVSDVVLHLGTDKKIKWASKTAADTFGRSRDEVVGLQCHAVCSQDGVVCQSCPVTRSLKSEQIEQGQLTDLQGRLWNVVAKPLFDDGGNMLGVVEIRNGTIQERAAASGGSPEG
jgi:PAS domain S-box-containing protein